MSRSWLLRGRPDRASLLLPILTASVLAAGTPAAAAGPPRLLADVRPGPASSAPGRYVPLGDRLLLVANDGLHGAELMAIESAGLAGRAHVVRDIRPGTNGARPAGLTRLGGWVLFAAWEARGGRELWRTDGTRTGTVRVADLAPGPRSANPSALTRMGGRVAFVTSIRGHGMALWITDGTAAGTRRLRAWAGMDAAPESLMAFGDRLGFAFKGRLWMSDGTVRGTRPVPLPRTLEAMTPVAAVGKLLFFRARPPSGCCVGSEPQLWRTDGTRAGTVRLRDSWAAGPEQLTVVGKRLAWFGDGGLWASDGTRAGTRRLVPLAHEGTDLTALGARVLYLHEEVNLWEQTTAAELWTADLATGVATRLLRLAVPEPEGNEVGLCCLVRAAGRIWLHGDEPEHGSEPWVSDGTAGGTGLVADLLPGPDGSGARSIRAMGERVVLTASDGVHGAEPWALTP